LFFSNRFQNYDNQSQFLGEILSPVKERWLSPDVKEAVWNAEKFLTYVGLNQAQVEPSSEDICGINRSHVRLPHSFQALSTIKLLHFRFSIASTPSVQFSNEVHGLKIWKKLKLEDLLLFRRSVTKSCATQSCLT
jgi:hypothetical protein